MNLAHPAGFRPLPPRTREGLALIEVIVYLGVLAVLLGVGYAALFESIESSAGLRRNTDEIVNALRAGEIWRADVRAARAIQLETNSAGGSLHLSGVRGEVWYQFADHTLRRRTGDNPWTKMLAEVTTSSFAPDPRPTVTPWRWELELRTRARKTGGISPRFTFLAVPGGEAPE